MSRVQQCSNRAHKAVRDPTDSWTKRERREDEAAALQKLNDHKKSGESGKQAHAAALAEAAELRRKADQANRDLEPHAA